METFDFMTDEKLKASLESDYAELQAVMKTGAWKAAQVLAGSIIEALLADCLAVTPPEIKDLLKLDLHGLISAAKTRGILSEDTERLSTVVRGYRNLIHPGRLIRNQEKVNEDTAQVAQALVNIIAKEVAAERKKTYGYTAEQVIDKIEHDSSALAILGDLLKGMKQPLEFERLLINVFPIRYFQYQAQLPSADYFEPREPSPEELALERTISSLEQCFWIVFKAASDEIKGKVAKNFVRILREESENNVLAYEARCFRCTELHYLSDDEVALVKRHILARFQNDRHINITTLLAVTEGIGAFLAVSEGAEFAQAICQTIAGMISWNLKRLPTTTVGPVITQEYEAMPEQTKHEFAQCFDKWIQSLQRQGKSEAAEMLQELQMWIPPI